MACSGHAQVVMLLKHVFLKIVLLTSFVAWADRGQDVILLLQANVGVKDETSGGFHRGELGVALKSAKGAPVAFLKAGSTLCQATSSLCSGQRSRCGSVSAVSRKLSGKETGFSGTWLACCWLSPFQ